MQVLPILTYNNHRLSSSPKVKYVLGKFNVKRQTPCSPKCHQNGHETYSIKGISHSVMISSVVTVGRYCHKLSPFTIERSRLLSPTKRTKYTGFFATWEHLYAWE